LKTKGAPAKAVEKAARVIIVKFYTEDTGLMSKMFCVTANFQLITFFSSHILK
jgi:hypothetical protein